MKRRKNTELQKNELPLNILFFIRFSVQSATIRQYSVRRINLTGSSAVGTGSYNIVSNFKILITKNVEIVMIFMFGIHLQIHSLSKVLSPFLVSTLHFAKLRIQCASKVTFYIVLQEEITYGRMNKETFTNFLVDIHVIRNFKEKNQIMFLFQLLLGSEGRSAHICPLWEAIALNLDYKTKPARRDPVSDVHHRQSLSGQGGGDYG